MSIFKRYLILISILLISILHAPQSYTLNAQAKTNIKQSSIHYSINKGDTFYLLSLRFNSSLSDILSMNAKKDPLNLQIDSKVTIPVGYGKVAHCVKKGETLASIASKYNTTVKVVADTNFIRNHDLIHKGDILAIPNLDGFPVDEFTSKLKQIGRDFLKFAEVRIEHGLLKIDHVSANLVPSMHTDKLVTQTLTSMGYRIVRGHTMENVECDYRVCGGTKLYTIGKAN